ncbi:hypothetical protein AAH978_14635 [Streptomyces sp. ZYX-F-203]
MFDKSEIRDLAEAFRDPLDEDAPGQVPHVAAPVSVTPVTAVVGTVVAVFGTAGLAAVAVVDAAG